MGFIHISISCLLGALIGWSTNVLAIKLIFRPYKCYKLFGVFPIQGLIPKRRSELALAIGEIVEKELLSSEELIQQLTSSGDVQGKFVQTISESIKNRLLAYLPPFIPSLLKENLLTIIDNVIMGEVETFFQEKLPHIASDIKDSIPVAAMVEEKINQLDISQLEGLILSIANKELKHIEYLGGLLGFMIGLAQGILLMLLTGKV